MMSSKKMLKSLEEFIGDTSAGTRTEDSSFDVGFPLPENQNHQRLHQLPRNQWLSQTLGGWDRMGNNSAGSFSDVEPQPKDEVKLLAIYHVTQVTFCIRHLYKDGGTF